MASRPTPLKIEVKFGRRADGGLEAWCDKIPAFFLSHSDPVRVVEDVEAALATILSAMYGVTMQVSRLSDLDEAEPEMPAHLCGTQEYVGLTNAH